MTALDLYYFSGTGNTLLVVNKLTEIFLKNNTKVNIIKIENSKPESIDTKKTIGLAFPVAMQSTYPFIWDFIKKLPKAGGTEVFMVDTLHAFSGAIVGPLKKILIKKGYNPIGAKEIIMPNNFRSKIDSDEDREKINLGLKTTEEFAYSLISKKTKWENIPILPHIFHFLASGKHIWNFIKKFGSKFKINQDLCTKCGICIEICPVKNIKMKNFPEHDNKCQLCLRCVMFCPSDAIKMPMVKIQKYKSVDVDKIKKL